MNNSFKGFFVNYKPFSAIKNSDIVGLVQHPEVPLMKTSKNKAILLKGVWIDGRLYARGSEITMEDSTCVVCPEQADMTLPVINVDPIDPRRQFWKAGEQREVGRTSRAKINVFAGLFLYSGFGSGYYFSSIANEVFFEDSNKASERARVENIPFVFFDSFDWTSDPALSRQRRQAQEVYARALAATTMAQTV